MDTYVLPKSTILRILSWLLSLDPEVQQILRFGL
jgi:hypothetical protein